MSKYFRRVCIGLLSGVVSCIILVAILNNVLEGICLGVLAGIAYAFIFHSDQRTYADNIMMAAVAGIVLWGSVNVVFLPLLGGQPPQWTVVGVRALFPSLVDFILWSICLGLLTAIFSDLAMYFLGKEDQLPLKRTVETRVIIVGGGFAGLATAEHLEQAFGADTSVSFTLISDVNALLFTPMLAEVAGGSLEPTHISTPLRSSLRRTRVVHGRVEQIDTAQKQVILAPELHSSQPRVMVFDHLVLAVGSVSNYAGLKGVEEHALDFKSLADSIRIREHVITMLERADQIVDPIQHRAMLTFVVAGGGFAGAELAGSLNDFVHGAIPYYPGISQNEVKIILLHSRDHILPELSQSLGDYALERMAARGVTFKLNTRLVDAQKGVVVLDTGESIRAETLVWTAGVKPHPLVQTLAAECDRRGALIVDSFLAVPGLPGIWALGDCALVTDAKTGKPCPPTAQFALHEAYTLAHNIHAFVHGHALKPFHYDVLGVLCVVGHHTACAEFKGMRFSGFFAWLLWRGVYLSKLPGLERKLRVLSDWIIELFFPRDIVQTMNIDDHPRIATLAQRSNPIISGNELR